MNFNATKDSLLAIYTITGKNSEEFLQGQLTADIKSIKESECRLAGYCSPNGKLIATLLVFKNDKCIKIALDKSIAEEVIKRLRLYVMRADVHFSQCEKSRIISESVSGSTAFSFKDKDVLGGLPYDGSPIGLFISTSEDMNDDIQSNNASSFDYFARLSGLPFLTKKSQNIYIPQSLNLDLFDAVNFKKGCYPGQEIIARVKYRGKPKQRMLLLSVDSEKTINANDSLFFSDETISRNGTVLEPYYDIESQTAFFLAVVPVSVVANHNIAIRLETGQEAKRINLPYDIPIDE